MHLKNHRKHFVKQAFSRSHSGFQLELIDQANDQVDGIITNYNMGLITNNERYNQLLDRRAYYHIHYHLLLHAIRRVTKKPITITALSPESIPFPADVNIKHPSPMTWCMIYILA
jgi:hypothetical protein